MRAGTTSYAYDAADELLSQKGPGVNVRYSYDRSGNETRAGSTRYPYNLANKLTQLSGASERVSYAYTGDGLAAERSSRNETTRYVWDTNAALGELAIAEPSLAGRQTFG